MNWANAELGTACLSSEILLDRLGWHPAASGGTMGCEPQIDNENVDDINESHLEVAELMLHQMRCHLTLVDETLLLNEMEATDIEIAAANLTAANDTNDGAAESFYIAESGEENDDLLQDVATANEKKRRKKNFDKNSKKNSCKIDKSRYLYIFCQVETLLISTDLIYV